MIKDNLEHKIEQLSNQDRKLLLYKLKEMISDVTDSNTTNK